MKILVLKIIVKIIIHFISIAILISKFVVINISLLLYFNINQMFNK